MERRRRLDPDERADLRSVVLKADQDQARADRSRDARDALLRTLRWGSEHRAPVSPVALIKAAGVSPTTFYRAVGRTKDRPAMTDGE